MGHEIEAIAIKRGHVIKLIVDEDNTNDLTYAKLKGIDVAIEFSSPDAACNNIIKCLEEKIPVVSGTTGWLDDFNHVIEICKNNNTAFIHSSNFSIGVNLLFRLNSELAKQMDKYRDYHVFVEEVHHTKKLDSPSGTAIALAGGITDNHSGYEAWHSESDKNISESIPIRSIREGLIPGIHTVIWDSDIDTLSLKHEAKSRKGFALGAVIAAEYIYNKKGIFTMNDVVGF